MAYDDGQVGQIQAPSESTPEQREAALKDYGVKVKSLKDQEAVLAKKIAVLDDTIIAREEELRKLYELKVESLGDLIMGREKELEEATEKLNGVNVEIDAKIKERDSINLYFQEREDGFKTRQNEFNQVLLDNEVRSKELDQKEERLKIKEEGIIETAADFEKTSSKALNDIQTKTNALVLLQAQVDSAQVKLNATLSETIVATDELNAAKSKIDTQVIELSTLTAQAEQVKADLAFIASEKKVIKDRQVQLDEDINQIKVTTQALANRKAELDARDKMIKEAEKNIGGANG